MHNEHSTAIPPEVITEIAELFQELLTKLEPYRTPLTTEERRDMAIVGDKTLAFLEKGKEFIDLYPDLVPSWLDKTEFTSDFEDVYNIIPIKNLADQVKEAVYNISYLAGNEAFHWILDYYHSARQAASRDIPNAKIVADELGKRFRHGKRKSQEEE